MRYARGRSLIALAMATSLGLVATACGPGFPGWPPDGGGGHVEPITVIAEGLEGPFGLTARNKQLFVAENSIGQITQVKLRNGDTSPSVTDLLSPSGVASVGHELAIVTGGSDVPDASITGDASVLVATPGGTAEVIADLEQFELDNNPDGQTQFDPDGNPLDALSNPFAVIAQKGGHGGYGSGGQGWALVADGGANAVLSVTRSGDVSTFFVPPQINTGGCEGVPNNDPEHPGCDQVPTGLAYGPDNTLYVSTLQSEVPGEGRVWIIDADTAEVRDVITGLDAPTGVAVRPDGTVYVSEVLYGSPEGDGPPPDDFDPASVGRLVRIAPDGSTTTASVTMPLSLTIHKGTLYSTAWAIAGFLGIAGAGQVVAVDDSAFG